MTTVARHNEEIQRNLAYWQKKPILRRIYADFHRLIAAQLTQTCSGPVVELGSGVADISQIIPGCIRTDLFSNPWIDQVENAYAMSFSDASVANLILFDVFHHLRYPGRALQEFHRILGPAGRVIIFEPCVSILGRLVYGLLHDEPLALKQKIHWQAPAEWSPQEIDYYAAQGNATRIFLGGEIDITGSGLRLLTTQRLSALSYVASGGYSKPQLFPDKAFPLMQWIDKIGDHFPSLFATRLLVVLEKTDSL